MHNRIGIIFLPFGLTISIPYTIRTVNNQTVLIIKNMPAVKSGIKKQPQDKPVADRFNCRGFALLVDLKGIEPSTSALRTLRSPN